MSRRVFIGNILGPRSLGHVESYIRTCGGAEEFVHRNNEKWAIAVMPTHDAARSLLQMIGEEETTTDIEWDRLVTIPILYAKWAHPPRQTKNKRERPVPVKKTLAQ